MDPRGRRTSEPHIASANGNRVSRRLRDGTAIGYQYDALNRVIGDLDINLYEHFGADLEPICLAEGPMGLSGWRSFNARIHYDKLVQIRPLRPFEKAFGATLLILEKRYEEGRREFERILQEIQDLGGEDIDTRYVSLYCRYYISLANKSGEHGDIISKAKLISPSRRIRRALPLPL